MNCKKLTLLFSFHILLFFNIPKSYGVVNNITTLGGGNVGLVSDNDSINFDADNTLNINSVKILDNVTTATNDTGTIDFNTVLNIKVDDLTITNDIGTTSNKIKGIVYSALENNLKANGNIYVGSNAITTSVNNQGTLTLSSGSSQTISSAIGSSSLRLKLISIEQSAGAVFDGNTYATTLTTSTGGGTLAISGTGSLDFSNSNINIDTTISTTGSSTSLGNVIVADGTTLTLNEDSTVNNLTVNNASSIAHIVGTKHLSILGDVSGSGIIQGDSAGNGNLIFSGSSAQNIASTVQFGTAIARLNTIKVENLNGVNLNNNIFVSTLDFNNASGTSTMSVAGTKTINVSGDITQSGAGNSAIKGSGTLLLAGSGAQAINSSLGESSSDRLGILDVSNGSAITFNKNLYVGTLNISTASAILNLTQNSDVTTLNVNENSTINNSATSLIATTNVADTKTLILSNDIALSDVVMGTTNDSNLQIANNKTLTINGDMSGKGGVSGPNNLEGDILFSGSSAQNVGSEIKIGNNSSKLNKLIVNNINGVTFGNDVYVSTLDFNNASSTSIAAIASGKAINVSGDVTQSGAGSSAIKGSGTLLLSGSAAQGVNAGLGTGSSDRLGSLQITNVDATGVSINQDSFLTTLDFNNGSGTSSASIASGKTIDISGDVAQSGAGNSVVKGDGTLLLSGSAAQGVNSSLGSGSFDRLGSLQISNIDATGISINQNSFLTTLDFNNASGTTTASISSTVDVSGNITQGGAGNSVIKGSGTLLMSGSGDKTIDTFVGLSSSRLGTLNMGAGNNVTFNQDAYLTSLTLNGNSTTISDNKTIDVINAVDLSGETVNFVFQDNAFGKLKTADKVTVNNSTNFVLKYGNNISGITYNDSGVSYKVIDAANAMTGNISDINVSDDSVIFDAVLSLDTTGGKNDIVAHIETSSTLDGDSLVENGTAIINNALNSGGDIAAQLANISTSSELKQALETLKVSATSGELIQSYQMLDSNIVNIATNRMQIVSLNSNFSESGIASGNESGLSSGNEYGINKSLWGEVFAGRAKQKVKNNDAGYKSHSGGFIIGGDRLLKNLIRPKINTVLGGAFSYNKNNIKSLSAGSGRTKVDSYQLTFYNNNSRDNGRGFFNNNIASVGFSSYKTARNVVAGSVHKVASGDFNGSTFSVQSGVGYNSILRNRLLFAPFASLKYFNVSQNNYSETGAGNDGFYVSNKDFNNVVAEIGFDLSGKADFYDFMYDNIYEDISLSLYNYEIVPKLRLSLQRNLQDNKQESSVSFLGGGSQIRSSSAQIERNSINLTTGLNISNNEQSSIDIRYQLQTAKKFKSHIGYIRYHYEF